MSKRKTKTHSMKGQVKYALKYQLRIGESKYAAQQKAKAVKEQLSNDDNAKKDMIYTPGIYSWSTYNSYVKHGTAFAIWTKETYGCKTLVESKLHIIDYIQYRIDKGLSAHTIKLDVSAICKLYKMHSKDLILKTPLRKRKNITRSRKNNLEDHKVHYRNNKKIIDFNRGVGLRRHEISKALVKDIYEKNGSLFIHVVGKGGKPRETMINPDFEEHVKICLKGLRPNDRIFKNDEIKNKIDFHSYRAEYACLMYKKFARDLKNIPEKERYICRSDQVGKVYDKVAMLKVSKNLGHERINVIASNYLYQL